MPEYGMGAEGMGVGGLVIWLIFAAIIITPFWKIFSKARFSKWLSLLMIVPLVNLVVLYFVAFARWSSRG